MNSSEILSNLKIDLSIKNRILAKNIILNSGITAKDIIDFIKKTNEKSQILLICVLDYIIENQPNYLHQDLNNFITLQQSFTNETCKRCSTRIIFHLLKNNIAIFNKTQKKKLINIHFDWLISNSLVATRVNCISVLFELRNEADWITTELQAIIDQQILLKEPSFVSRGKKILKMIIKIK